MNPKKKTQAQPLAVGRLYIRYKIAGLTPRFTAALQSSCGSYRKTGQSNNIARKRTILAKSSNFRVFTGSKIDPPSVYGAKIPHTIYGPKFSPIRFTG